MSALPCIQKDAGLWAYRAACLPWFKPKTMKKYPVNVTRIEQKSCTIYVKAKSQEDAAKAAEDLWNGEVDDPKDTDAFVAEVTHAIESTDLDFMSHDFTTPKNH